MTIGSEYAPGPIEEKWQGFWREREIFRTRRAAGEKFYCYNPAPYVTGALHMGHVRNYTYGDFLSRYKRLRGAGVLYTIGFDAFGVPTEMAAIRQRVAPGEWTARCIAEMKRQMTRMGFSFDWERSFTTSDPDYYRWTQWIFIEMLRDGLVYEKDAETLWCPRCEMALARSLTISGCCTLCRTRVESRITRQWFLRISRYLDRLRSGLRDVVDPNGQARAGQESLLAVRSLPGVRLRVEGSDAEITACLESRAHWQDDLVLAVHQQDAGALRRLGIDPGGPAGAPSAASAAGAASAAAELTHVRLLEPGTGRRFGVATDPALDPLYADQPLLRPVPGSGANGGPRPDPPGGFLALEVEEQKDFSISRQRLWGTPIPMIRCRDCGSVPVPSADLPVLLPELRFDDEGLLRRPDGSMESRRCPSCGRAGEMDPQVLDCHFDALWHYCRPCSTPGESPPFGNDEFRYWMPVDHIQFGRDTIPFLLTMRMFTMFLHDRGLSGGAEFARETLAHGLILKDNLKMSKHLGNVVDPAEIVSRFGADSLRFTVLARNEPKSDYTWSDDSVAHYHEILRTYYEDVASSATDGPVEDRDAAEGTKGKYLSIFLTKILREVEILESSVEKGRFDVYARAVAGLLTSLHVFRSRYHGTAGPCARSAWAACSEQAVIYLAPIAPHLAEECWGMLGRAGSLFEGAAWPGDGAGEIRRLLEGTQGRVSR